MNLVLLFVATALFVILSPGFLVTLPSRGSRKMVLLVHGLIFFAILFFFGHMLKNMVTRVTGIEGMKEGKKGKKVKKGTEKMDNKTTETTEMGTDSGEENQ